MTRGRRALFAVIAVLLGVSVGLLMAEYGLRYYAGYVQSREKMDPGFLIFNPQLGWELAHDWRGRHRHYDFDVVYSTNDMGLRGPWPEPGFDSPVVARRHVLLGDSFTFGLGVNDDETFVRILDNGDQTTRYLNAGVAGYSTGQEYLYLRQHLAEWKPDRLTLVVYLANDLLDNTLAYPLQADMGKPFFALQGEALELKNVPVRLGPKPPDERRRTLATMVLGDEYARRSARSWISRWQLARSLGLADRPTTAELDGMAERLQYPIDLFVRLAQQMHQLCATNGVDMDLVMMPGRSYVEQPSSISAQYQEILRAAIDQRQTEIGVPVIDLASRLRQQYQSGKRGLYYPHEGHLTATGNALVAELLRELLSDT